MLLRPVSALTILLALGLSACGGGSGDLASLPFLDSRQQTESVTIEGRAVKGVLQSASVDAYALEGGERRHLARTRTDSSGNFSIEVPGFSSGPVLLEATAGDQSRMVCDAISGCGAAAFGDSVALGGDFELRALLTPADGDRGTVAITPLTDLAAVFALGMPGALEADEVRLARDRVSGLMLLDSDFAFQRVPDLTHATELAGADTGASRHALMAAAFAERATNLAVSMPALQDRYRDRFRRYAGQMRHEGDNGLGVLLYAAWQIADQRSILPSVRDSLQTRMGSMEAGISRVAARTDYDQSDFDNARTALNDLDHYLVEAGIDDSGTFLADQAHQVNWLYEPEVIDLVDYTVRSGIASALAAIMAGVYKDDPDAPATVDLSQFFGSSTDLLTVEYRVGEEKLVINGFIDSQTLQYLDIAVDITPLTVDQQVLTYGVQGETSDTPAQIGNAVATGRLDGTLKLDFHDTDLDGLILELQKSIDSTSDSTADLTSALKDLIPKLHVRATVNGRASLVKSNEDFGFNVDNVSAWGELNLPALESGTGDVFAMAVDSGSFTSPEGDRIGVNPDSGQPGLALQVGQDAHLQADYVAQGFGLPPMKVRADGSLANTGEVLDAMADRLDSLDWSNLAVSDVINLVSSIDWSVLELDGTGSLEINDDGPRGRRTYAFTLEDNRLDASLPNSSEQALRFYLSARNGGYIYAGDSLIATVTFDWKQLGATLHFTDGSQRSYYLGPVTDIVDTAFIEDLLSRLGFSL